MEDKNLSLWGKYQDAVFATTSFLDNVIVKTEGLYIIDANGKKIIDFGAGAFCSILGHNHPKLTERLKRQLDIAIHTGIAFSSLTFFEAAEKVSAIVPGGAAKVMFLSTGSEANEAAIKIAKECTGRHGIIGFDHGHVGSTFLMKQMEFLNNTGPSGKPHIPGIYKMLTPACHKCPVGGKYPECDFMCIKISVNKIRFHLRSIAAMIAEPILSRAGVIVPPPGYFKRLKQVLDEYGILTIIDEAQTGFGRTGKWFAIEHYDIIPDMLVASKTCGSGYPVSLVAVHPRIQDRLIGKGFNIAASHINDPLGAAAVSAVIDIIRDEKMPERADETGKYFIKELSALKNDFAGLIRDIRGIGLMIGLEVGEYNGQRPQEIGLRLAYTMIENGLNFNWFSPSVLIFEPPLIITNEDIDEAVRIIRKSIEDVLKDRSRNEKFFKKNPIGLAKDKPSGEKQSFFRRVFRRIWR